MEIIEETERLIIKEMMPEDEKEGCLLLSAFNEEDVEKSFDRERFMAYLENAYGFYGYGYYGVYERKKGKLIGIAGFREGSCPLEIGYCIDKKFRNNGYAKEAVGALIKYAREYFGWVLEETKSGVLVSETETKRLFVFKVNNEVLVYGRVEKNNDASVRVLLDNGFTESESFLR